MSKNKNHKQKIKVVGNLYTHAAIESELNCKNRYMFEIL
jgi:hypothetical protein